MSLGEDTIQSITLPQTKAHEPLVVSESGNGIVKPMFGGVNVA